MEKEGKDMAREESHQIPGGGKISHGEVARHFSHQNSAWQPKVFVKTFGWPMAGL